jgi:hypothetical protein
VSSRPSPSASSAKGCATERPGAAGLNAAAGARSLEGAVLIGQNIVVAGGTQAGKPATRQDTPMTCILMPMSGCRHLATGTRDFWPRCAGVG